ncbi:MAG: 2-amino-4-hydroxy-6-hydroxymethyldihydropteridine diphosphokinase [Chlorobi bacterium]|nr:2-amino-4-hydroxy-6-hydroxymethyldihydropteridine diphosphokinase [Chlorobiota bacterium]
MHSVFVGIGGNIGDKPLVFRQARGLIDEIMGNIILSSSIYESPPWGFESEDTFWNQVLKIVTNLSPAELLGGINRIEGIFGRKRTSTGYSSRQMDIDILYFDDLILETEELTIPHPLLHKRMFVLAPLCEIAPDFIHPVLRLTSKEMKGNCTDKSVVSRHLKNI